MADIIAVTADNLDEEHICCAITEKKGEHCAASKKAWMRERFAEGLVFKKLNARGKVFIEYIPAEHAWTPIDAAGYMHINCLWVSGQFKGQGLSNRLLDECLADAGERGCLGATVLSSARKRPFLSDGGYFKHKGFAVADKAEPFYELLYLPFAENAPVPQFREQAKPAALPASGPGKGLVLYYTNQCPFAEKHALLLESAAKQRNVPCTLRKLESAAQAQGAPAPFTAYSLYRDGAFVTSEILSEKKIEALLDGMGG